MRYHVVVIAVGFLKQKVTLCMIVCFGQSFWTNWSPLFQVTNFKTDQGAEIILKTFSTNKTAHYIKLQKSVVMSIISWRLPDPATAWLQWQLLLYFWKSTGPLWFSRPVWQNQKEMQPWMWQHNSHLCWNRQGGSVGAVSSVKFRAATVQQWGRETFSPL